MYNFHMTATFNMFEIYDILRCVGVFTLMVILAKFPMRDIMLLFWKVGFYLSGVIVIYSVLRHAYRRVGRVLRYQDEVQVYYALQIVVLESFGFSILFVWYYVDLIAGYVMSLSTPYNLIFLTILIVMSFVFVEAFSDYLVQYIQSKIDKVYMYLMDVAVLQIKPYIKMKLQEVRLHTFNEPVVRLYLSSSRASPIRFEAANAYVHIERGYVTFHKWKKTRWNLEDPKTSVRGAFVTCDWNEAQLKATCADHVNTAVFTYRNVQIRFFFKKTKIVFRIKSKKAVKSNEGATDEILSFISGASLKLSEFFDKDVSEKIKSHLSFEMVLKLTTQLYLYWKAADSILGVTAIVGHLFADLSIMFGFAIPFGEISEQLKSLFTPLFGEADKEDDEEVKINEANVATGLFSFIGTMIGVQTLGATQASKDFSAQLRTLNSLERIVPVAMSLFETGIKFIKSLIYGPEDQEVDDFFQRLIRLENILLTEQDKSEWLSDCAILERIFSIKRRTKDLENLLLMKSRVQATVTGTVKKIKTRFKQLKAEANNLTTAGQMQAWVLAANRSVSTLRLLNRVDDAAQLEMIISTIKTKVESENATLLDDYIISRKAFVVACSKLLKKSDGELSEDERMTFLALPEMWQDLAIQGTELLNARLSIPPFPEFSTLQNKINERLPRIRSLVSSARYRVEPVFVLFAGKPNVGKTLDVSVLSQYLLFKKSRTKIDENGKEVADETYISYSTPDKDGRMDNYYEDAEVLVCDEIFQKKDKDTSASTVEFLIKLVNIAPYNCATAVLDKKGMNFIHPKFVIGTTNNTNLGNQAEMGVVTKNNLAFMRRVAFYVDPQEPAQGIGPDVMDKLVFNVTGSAIKKRGVTTAVMGLSTLCESVWEEHLARQGTFATYGEAIHNYVRSIAKTSGSPPMSAPRPSPSLAQAPKTKKNEGYVDDLFTEAQKKLFGFGARVYVANARWIPSMFKRFVQNYVLPIVLKVVFFFWTPYHFVKPYAKQYYAKFQNWWKKPENRKKVILAVVVLVVLLIVVIILKRRQFKKKNETHEYDKKSRDKKVKVNETHERSKRTHDKKQKINENGKPVKRNEGFDQFGQGVVNKIASTSLRTFWNRIGNTTALALGGEYYVTVAHQWISMKDDDIFGFVGQDGVMHRLLWKSIKKVLVPNRDLMVMRLRNFFSKKIYDRLISDKALGMLSQQKEFKNIDYVSLDFETGRVHTREVAYAKYNSSTELSDDTRTYVTKGFMMLNVQSAPGECGSVYVLRDPKFGTERIAFVHTGRYEDMAIGEPFTREDFSRALTEMGEELVLHDSIEQTTIKENQSLKFDPNATCPFTFPGSLPIGVVDSKSASFMSDKSDFVKSLYGKGRKTVTGPLHLRSFRNKDGEYKNPIRTYTDKLKKFPAHPVDADLIRMYTGPIHEEWKVRNLKDSVIPLKIAVGGDEACNLAPVSTSTSAGHWHRNEVTSGKVPLVTFDEKKQEYVLSESMEQDYKAYIDRIVETRNIPDCVVKDQLKDERKRWESVEAGKSRIFSGSTFIYWIAFRQYFGAWLDSIKGEHPFGPCMVGVNAVGFEWDVMDRNLKTVEIKKYLKMIGGDYAGFDIGLPYEVRAFLLEEILLWYEKNTDCTPMEQFIRRRLFQASMFHVHIFMNLLYGRPFGQDSGNPATAETNSVCGEILMRCAFVHVAMQQKMSVREAQVIWRDCVRKIYYGDDNLLSLARPAQFFTQPLAQKAIFELFGMRYTAADKGEFTSDFTDPSEYTFLKRTSVPMKEGFDRPMVGRMPLDLCIDIACWVRKSAGSKIAATRENMESSLREIFFWGEEEFEKMRAEYNNCLHRHRAASLDLSYQDCMETWLKSASSLRRM